MKHIRSSLCLLAIVSLLFALICIIGCAEQVTSESKESAPTTYTIMFQNGVFPTASYASTEDNAIRCDSPDDKLNYGASTDLYVGGHSMWMGWYRGLIRFDVSTIEPSSVTVTGASLTLSLEAYTGTPTIEVHKILQRWAEGTSNGTIGISNYITREGISNWTIAGGSYDATVIDSKVVNSGISVTFNISPAIVQSWIDNPTTNYGLLLKRKDDSTVILTDGILFYSRNNATKENRPRLTISFTLR